MKREKERQASRRLTRREAEVLGALVAFADEPDGELVYQRGTAWLGLQKVSKIIVFSLLRSMFISLRGGLDEVTYGVEHYHVNETGKEALWDHWGIDKTSEGK